MSAARIEIPLLPVESSNIAEAGYAPEHKLLDIKFKTGAVHRYEEVPPLVWEQFQVAESKGRYFGERIRGAFSNTRIVQADKDRPEGQQPQNAPEQRTTTLNPQAAWPFPSRG